MFYLVISLSITRAHYKFEQDFLEQLLFEGQPPQEPPFLNDFKSKKAATNNVANIKIKSIKAIIL